MISRHGKKNKLDQDQLCQISRDILEKHRTSLVENLNPENHFPVLKSRNAITSSECDEILQLGSRTRRAERLIEILITRGNNGYLALAESMVREKTQMFLLRKLNQSFESQRRWRESSPNQWQHTDPPFSLQPQSILPPEAINYFTH